MSRKNIFEIISGTFNISREVGRIIQLFETDKIVSIPYKPNCTIFDFVQVYGFAHWRNRGHCINANDFLDSLGYKTLWKRADTNPTQFLTLIEIIYNFWYIVEKATGLSNEYDGAQFALLKEIMDDCLAHYNHKGVYFSDLEQLIVIEDKPEATAVAEIVDEEVAFRVLRYNHYSLKGDLNAKKDILLALGADLEPKKKNIGKIDKKLEDGIFYILNNLNLRHNNITIGDPKYKPFVAKMDESTLESWYDELYQMMLLAYLQLDQADRFSRFETLKRSIEVK